MKDEPERRWGTIDLLDVLKEADHVTGFTDEFTSVASREITGREEVRRAPRDLVSQLGVCCPPTWSFSCPLSRLSACAWPSCLRNKIS
jgi:hypothetical protein